MNKLLIFLIFIITSTSYAGVHYIKLEYGIMHIETESESNNLFEVVKFDDSSITFYKDVELTFASNNKIDNRSCNFLAKKLLYFLHSNKNHDSLIYNSGSDNLLLIKEEFSSLSDSISEKYYAVDSAITVEKCLAYKDNCPISYFMDPYPMNPHPINPHPINPHPMNPHPINPHPINPHPINPHPMDPYPMDPYPMNSRPMNPHPMNKFLFQKRNQHAEGTASATSGLFYNLHLKPSKRKLKVNNSKCLFLCEKVFTPGNYGSHYAKCHTEDYLKITEKCKKGFICEFCDEDKKINSLRSLGTHIHHYHTDKSYKDFLP